MLVSPSATLEEQYLAARLARGLGCKHIDHRLRQSDFRGDEADPANATAEAQAAILKMQDAGEISGGQAKEIYEIVLKTGRAPDEIADSEGLKQVSDTGAIEAAIDEIIASNGDKVEEYRGGKDKLFGFFVGQTMKAMQGKANPQVVNELLKKALG